MGNVARRGRKKEKVFPDEKEGAEKRCENWLKALRKFTKARVSINLKLISRNED